MEYMRFRIVILNGGFFFFLFVSIVSSWGETIEGPIKAVQRSCQALLNSCIGFSNFQGNLLLDSSHSTNLIKVRLYQRNLSSEDLFAEGIKSGLLVIIHRRHF